MTLSTPSFLAAAIKADMPPQAAAEVAVVQLVVGQTKPPDNDTPTSVLPSRPVATATFSLFTNTCTAS